MVMAGKEDTDNKLMEGGATALRDAIRHYALTELGFSAIGFAKADRVSDEQAQALRRWLDEGDNAGMTYMENWYEKRIDPRLLMPGLKTIVSVALNYAPAHTLPKGEPQISAYALGKDYHDIMKGKLFKLAEAIFNSDFFIDNSTSSPSITEDSNHKAQCSKLKAQRNTAQSFRVFVDTGPVLERYWAVQAGLGWIGKNHQLIIPHAGSMFFLGELFLDFELPYDKPMKSFCGNCHRCVDACPTGAIYDATLKNKEEGIKNKDCDTELEDCNHKAQSSMLNAQRNQKAQCSMLNAQSNQKAQSNRPQTIFDARKCLSYQLIENRGELSETAKEKMGDTFYGCDRCQTACPWNRFATPNTTPELQPSEELLHMTREKWEHLTVEEYRKLFKGSAVKRAKYDGLMRNIKNLK